MSMAHACPCPEIENLLWTLTNRSKAKLSIEYVQVLCTIYIQPLLFHLIYGQAIQELAKPGVFPVILGHPLKHDEDMVQASLSSLTAMPSSSIFVMSSSSIFAMPVP